LIPESPPGLPLISYTSSHPRSVFLGLVFFSRRYLWDSSFSPPRALAARGSSPSPDGPALAGFFLSDWSIICWLAVGRNYNPPPLLISFPRRKFPTWDSSSQARLRDRPVGFSGDPPLNLRCSTAPFPPFASVRWDFAAQVFVPTSSRAGSAVSKPLFSFRLFIDGPKWATVWGPGYGGPGKKHLLRPRPASIFLLLRLVTRCASLHRGPRRRTLSRRFLWQNFPLHGESRLFTSGEIVKTTFQLSSARCAARCAMFRHIIPPVVNIFELSSLFSGCYGWLFHQLVRSGPPSRAVGPTLRVSCRFRIVKGPLWRETFFAIISEFSPWT